MNSERSTDTEYLRAVEEAIAAWLDNQPPYLDGFYSMMRYHLEAVDADSMSQRRARERRLGTVLCLLSATAVGGHSKAAVRAAAGLALLFASLRIHDDIERHHMNSAGQPALWTRWGMPQALNTGDGLVSLAANAVLDAIDSADVSIALARELASVSLSFMDGQHALLQLDPPTESDRPAVARAIERTSGTLGGFSAWIGAVLGGAGETTQAHLRSFGTCLGTARGFRDLLSDNERSETISGLEFTREIARSLDRAMQAVQRSNIDATGKRMLIDLASDSAG